MARGRPRGVRWAGWLGVLALALNALVPIHLAYDLAAAIADRPAAGEHAGHHHQHSDGKPHHHHGDDGKACQFCAAAVTLAGFGLPSAVVLPTPTADAASLPAGAAVRFVLKAAPAAYRSRAPPIA